MAARRGNRTYRVVGVPGSLRRDSFNRRLVRHAAAVAPPGLCIEVADDLIRLPLFDEDLEIDGSPPEVVAMQERLAAADALLVSTPEYNFGLPGPVKNFVDWASRPVGQGPLVGKPVAIIGASIGKTGGTVQAQSQLRVSLAVIGAHVMPSPPVLVAEAHERFDGHELVHPDTDKMLRYALDRFAAFLSVMVPAE